jgi:uncharacterized membrane-anchored protein YhcB (DUF1043 family)
MTKDNEHIPPHIVWAIIVGVILGTVMARLVR